MSLQSDLAERLKTRLTRSSLVSPSRWACQYRFMQGDFPGLWRFESHPWLLDMHDSKYELNIGQKAAQMGYSETMLNLTFFNLDIMKRNVLYILPNLHPDATDFTTRAFNPAIDMSPHIKSMFTSTNNVGHKVVGNANLYIRGSNARSALKSVPASVLIFDEFDEMNRVNVNLAEERSSGQEYRLNWKVSTPTVPGKGINTQFMASTQDHYFFDCPSCSRKIELRFPENLVITGDDPDDPKILESHLICAHCKARLEHKAKRGFLKTGRWESMNPGRLMRGFYINQMYSTVLEPHKLARAYLLSKKDLVAEQEFYNSKLGLPHVIEGAQITDEMLGDLIKGYQMVEACKPGLVITMGVDVGSTCHVEIDQWDLSQVNPIDVNAKARCKVLWAGEVSKDDNLKELSALMVAYNVTFAVVDAMPETQLVTQWCNEWYGRARICRYNHYATARSAFAGKDDVQVSVNRTSWLDCSIGRFRNKSILLPSNLPKDYCEHIKALIRKPEKDANGNLVYKYVNQDDKADHYAHARNYAEIALLFATGFNVFKPITEKV